MSQGLYNLNEFKDNCGFGLIAHVRGQASHKILATAIESLTCMTHRGGIAADGKTGDGCGLLLQKPDSFLRQVAQENNIQLGSQYAIGSLMLSQDDATREAQKACVEKMCEQQQLIVNGWRSVSVNPDCLGQIALQSMPVFEQLFISNDALSKQELGAHLLVLRRKLEKSIAASSDSGNDISDGFYITSLSVDTLIYKGLMMPADLPIFFADLADARMETAICVFHQRFSTNTLPQWPLAQPFRLLAHNGEINTIVGNRNWSVGRTNLMRSEVIDKALESGIEEITPLVNAAGSDSSSLDNMLEYLTVGGMDIHHAIRMMVPPAWKNVQGLSHKRRAFFEYNAMHMEPWDGPAGLVMTDGRYAVCTLDRNGLRPSRWVLTDDDILTVASEVGVYSYQPETVVAKGRLGPGEILSIDTKTSTIQYSEDIDESLSSQAPYSQWLRDNSVRIKGDLSVNFADNNFDDEHILKMQKQFQVSLEECQQVLRPMGELGQEATGSMGDDIPMAVLSRQNRSSV